jgi:hypothetical protein
MGSLCILRKVQKVMSDVVSNASNGYISSGLMAGFEQRFTQFVLLISYGYTTYSGSLGSSKDQFGPGDLSLARSDMCYTVSDIRRADCLWDAYYCGGLLCSF